MTRANRFGSVPDITAGTMATNSSVAKSIFTANSVLKADTASNPEALTLTEQTLLGRITGGEVTALSITQIKTLLGAAAASGLATLNSSTKVVEQPASISDHLLDEDDMATDSATKVPSQQSVKAYVDGLNTGRGATFLVAASDANATIIAQADYVCDGTADDVQIQAAIDALPAGGGKVLLSEGTFSITAYITLASNCILQGQGFSTLIQTTGNIRAIYFDGITNATIRDINIDGNSSTVNTLPLGTGTYITVENCWVHGGGLDGIGLGSGTGKNLNNVIVYSTTRYGINCYNESLTSVGARINNCLVYETGDDGVVGINSADIAISNTVSRNNTGAGFHFNGCKGIVLNNCIAYTNGEEGFDLYDTEYSGVNNCLAYGNTKMGIDLDTGADYSSVSNSIFYLNGEEGILVYNSSNVKVVGNTCIANSATTDNTDSNIELRYNSDNCLVIGNLCRQGSETNQPKYGISVETSTCGDNIIRENDIRDSGQTGNYSDVGTGTICRDNYGYIASGEVRTVSGSLTAGVANAITFAWHNPEAQDILIRKVVVEITTGSAAANSVIDAGITDDATGTNRGTEFFDDLDANDVDVNDSWVAGDGGTQTKWVLCQDSASATDGWVVGQILVANAAALVGKYYIEYAGR